MSRINWDKCSWCNEDLHFCRCGAEVRCHECGEVIEYGERCVLAAHDCPNVFCRECQKRLYWEMPMPVTKEQS